MCALKMHMDVRTCAKALFGGIIKIYKFVENKENSCQSFDSFQGRFLFNRTKKQF